ncbi:MAG: choice-of-anchor Q domain-containing protein, partial [Gammaproteobacteria bacterium]|nr:choice-of-anchor Q domain-containing protein [Gammaproteobacteria bacterium]
MWENALNSSRNNTGERRWNNVRANTNSTISGNRGGGVKVAVDATGSAYVSITDSTISDNTANYNNGDSGGVTAMARPGAADATVTLDRSLVAGNTASEEPYGVYVERPTLVSEIDASGKVSDRFVGITVTADNYNLFGTDGDAGVSGFTPGPTDIVPAVGVPLSAILDSNLADNGGPTLTHALVSGSPAIDAVPASADCGGTDQRGESRR